MLYFRVVEAMLLGYTLDVYVSLVEIRSFSDSYSNC